MILDGCNLLQKKEKRSHMYTLKAKSNEFQVKNTIVFGWNWAARKLRQKNCNNINTKCVFILFHESCFGRAAPNSSTSYTQSA